MRIEEIYKRNHTKRPFEIQKITDAVLKAMISVKVGTLKDAETIAEKVKKQITKKKNDIPHYIPNVEEIQDLVEQTLMKSEFLDVAKAYILYRNIQTKKGKEIFLKEESHSSHTNIQSYMNTYLQ